MYISGGENVYPAEVQRVLKQHPAVDDAAVVGAPHDKWGEAGCAFVILKDSCACSAEELLAHCRQRLAGYKAPRMIQFRSELPRTPLGKVRKFLLMEQAKQAGGKPEE